MLSDYFIFVKELPKSFAQIGAMLPSSRIVGRLMVRPLKRRKKRPVTILEVGPGTGPFTRQILKLMGPRDTFVICEINPRFVSRLKQTLINNKDYINNKERVFFFEGPVQNICLSDLPQRYDIIVSSLPFVNFDPDTVREILVLFERMMNVGASLTFLQYVGVAKLREVVASKTVRRRVKKVEEIIDRWCAFMSRRGRVKKRVSFLNLPPAMSVEITKERV